ncbi:MAG: hypothetical protein ACI8QY_000504, partial [bacterium]
MKNKRTLKKMKTLILVNSTLLFIFFVIAIAIASDDRTARRYTSTPLQITHGIIYKDALYRQSQIMAAKARKRVKIRKAFTYTNSATLKNV